MLCLQVKLDLCLRKKRSVSLGNVDFKLTDRTLWDCRFIEKKENMDRRKKWYKKKEDTQVEKKRTVRTGKRVNLEESINTEKRVTLEKG